MEVLFAQIGNESGEVRESLGIDGEWSILVLVVDVEVEHVGRNLVGAETVGDLPSLGFRSVAVARLLEAKRPQRRKWRHSGEISVAFHDLFRRGAIEKIIVERAAFGAEGNRVARLLAEVKPRAPGVVEEHAITAGAADCEEEPRPMRRWSSRARTIASPSFSGQRSATRNASTRSPARITTPQAGSSAPNAGALPAQ